MTFPCEERCLISRFNWADLHCQCLALFLTLLDQRALCYQPPSPLGVIYRFD